jgi:hypothetical protein
MSTDSDQLTKMVEHIRHSFGQTGAVFVWIFAEEANQLIRNMRHSRTIHNASLESTLVNLRALNEFFTPYSTKKKRHHDDVRATDFPRYQTKGAFLSELTLNEIHRRLAHFSFKRLETDPGWEIRHLMEPAIDRMLHFLDYLRNDFLPFHHPELFHVIALYDSLREFTPEGKIMRVINNHSINDWHHSAQTFRSPLRF